MRFFSAILFFLLMANRLSFAQVAPSNTDSLEALLRVAENGDKVDLYNQLSMLYRHNDYFKGMEYAIKAIDLSDSLSDWSRIAKSYSVLAINERNAGMMDSSLSHFKCSYRFVEKYQLDSLIAYSANNVARLSLEFGLLDSAQKYTDIAMESATLSADMESMSYCYMNYGIINYQRGNNPAAKDFLKKAYDIRHDTLGIRVDYLLPLWYLSDIYIQERNFDMARDMMLSNLADAEHTDWHDYTSRVWYRLSQIYYWTKNYDSAEYACKNTILKSYECNNVERVECAYKMLDSVYLATGDFRKAAEICLKFVEISDTIVNQRVAYELHKIKHTAEYLKNEKSLYDFRYRRNIILLILVIILGFGFVAVRGLKMIFQKRRQIRSLHRQLMDKYSLIMDEVMNASILQSKFQPEVEAVLPMFPDKFLLYMPKDIVSGDFVWKFSDDEYELLAVADCTGHGVPGALLTMLGMSSLHEIALSGVRNSAEILEKLRSKIIGYMSMNALKKMEDGMDISLITINKKTLQLDFAGAYNNLLYIRDGKLQKLKATRCPIGDYIISLDFQSQYLQLKKGDCVFMLSDGYISQFGGPEGRKLPQQKLFNILQENHDKPMEELRQILIDNYIEWQGEREQVDDVSILGFRVS